MHFEGMLCCDHYSMNPNEITVRHSGYYVLFDKKGSTQIFECCLFVLQIFDQTAAEDQCSLVSISSRI